MSRNGSSSAPQLDQRARRSKAALEAALLDLAEVEDLAQISVSDIAKYAGVSRSTFYEHYTDVHDLAASACTTMFDKMVTSMPLADPQLVDVAEPADNPIAPLFAHFAEHAQLYRSLLGPDGSARVINHLLHHLRIRTHTNLRHAAEGSSASPRAESVPGAEPALIAGALLGIVTDWLGRDPRETPEQLADTVWPALLAAATARGL